MAQTFGAYEPIRQAGDTFYVAGQVGVDSATRQTLSSFTGQMHQAMKNLVSVLKAKDLTLKDVVSVRVYLTDMDTFNEMNDIFASHFTGIGPSRECIGVASLPPVGGDEALQIEISAIAYKVRS